MIRKTLTILSLIGLLLSVGLWGASYWNFMCHVDEHRHLLLVLGHGKLAVFYWAERTIWPQEWAEERRAEDFSFRREQISMIVLRTTPDAPSNKRTPFRFEKTWGFVGYRGMETSWLPGINRYANSLMALHVPLWIPSLVFASFTYLGFRPFYRRRKRKKLGLSQSKLIH